MRFRKISSQKFDPTGDFFHDSAIQMQAFIAFAAQKFGINENTFYLCNVRINVLTIQVCFLRGQAVNVTTQFVKPYIKCAALTLSKPLPLVITQTHLVLLSLTRGFDFIKNYSSSFSGIPCYLLCFV